VTRNPSLVKCLVWDLDNTLWHGTILEDEDVQLREAIRETVAALDSRGILQSIASKNDLDMAWTRLEQLGMAEYFILPKIGWGRKSDSVREIADELNFAYKTIAFIDDQASERAEVLFHLPDVRCYTAEQASALTVLPEFSPEKVTVDARRRRLMYQASFQRAAERETFAGDDVEFLRSLQIELEIQRADTETLDRVAELTLRTSQMNATGVPYPHGTLQNLLADPGHEVLVAAMSDRFGSYGAIGVILLEYHSGVWNLKLLATSCRVVSLGAGAAIINWLADQARRANVHLAADFRATGRNRMMEVAYRFSGFTEDACQCLTALKPTIDHDDIQRMHLVPELRPPLDHLRLDTPVLGRVLQM
jgi:methoxymalonate biosynthesis protein